MPETRATRPQRQELHVSEQRVGGAELLSAAERVQLHAEWDDAIAEAWFAEGDRFTPTDVAQRFNEQAVVERAQQWYQKYFAAAEDVVRDFFHISEQHVLDQAVDYFSDLEATEAMEQAQQTRILFERLKRCFADDKAERAAAAQELIGTTVRILDADYTLRKKLGKGSYGITFLADSPQHPKPVVVKLSEPYDHLKIHATDDELVDKDDKIATMVARNMILEIASLHRLTRDAKNKPLSEDIDLPFARLYGAQFIRHPDRRSGPESYLACAVQEYIPGNDLRRYIVAQPGHHLQAYPGFVRNVAWQLIDAVQQAHAKGVLHCDIKPGNVMVTAEARVKLIDWGSSHLPDKTANPKVMWAQASGLFTGTPEFMSMPYDAMPSKARDVYAIGCTIQRMIYGYERELKADERAVEEAGLDRQLQVLSRLATEMTRTLPAQRIDLAGAMNKLDTEFAQLDRPQQVAG